MPDLDRASRRAIIEVIRRDGFDDLVDLCRPFLPQKNVAREGIDGPLCRRDRPRRARILPTNAHETPLNWSDPA